MRRCFGIDYGKTFRLAAYAEILVVIVLLRLMSIVFHWECFGLTHKHGNGMNKKAHFRVAARSKQGGARGGRIASCRQKQRQQIG